MENKTVWIVVGVVIALVASVPLLAQLKKGMGGSAAPAASSTEAPAASATAIQPPLLNASNLVGTAWSAKGYTVQLGAGGVATANTPFGAVSGTWTVDGTKVTISAMGRTIVGQISGDQLLVDGQPVPRAQ